METILVVYWQLREFPDLQYKHGEKREYSLEAREEIISDILAHNYSVMLRPSKKELTIWIDKGRFGQS